MDQVFNLDWKSANITAHSLAIPQNGRVNAPARTFGEFQGYGRSVCFGVLAINYWSLDPMGNIRICCMDNQHNYHGGMTTDYQFRYHINPNRNHN